MAGFLGGLEVGVPCPGCGHETTKSLGWLKSHDQMVCGGCGEQIPLNDDGFRKSLADAEKRLVDFGKKFK